MNFGLLIGCIVLCQLAGIVGSVFTFRSIPGWYKKLKKPSINPPSWVFGPVWTLLFLLMGVSIYLVFNAGLNSNAFSIAFFFIQLFLNILWSFLFFYLKKPGLAFLEVIVLWLAILITIILFYPISKLASWLLVPYLLWVSFASILNFLIWKLNKK